MNNLDLLIKLAIEEDIGSGDITSQATIPEALLAKAQIRAKQDLVVSGLDVARRVFAEIDPSISWKTVLREGERCGKDEVIAVLEGKARALLAGERTALNFLQRLSGIATLTRTFVDAIAGTKARVLDTRKTTPGFRILEKDAVHAGGGTNHRMGLFDHFLIKNNHITAAGSVSAALERAKAARKPGQKIEIEARAMDEVKDALECGADIIMLDNMSVDQVRDAKALVAGRALLEVSGNVTLANVHAYAETGVDFISVGAITHSPPAADINMLIEIGS
ncbi:MAG: carboxylating nicotinate-nucleotide diphosphorylase [bacterium]